MWLISNHIFTTLISLKNINFKIKVNNSFTGLTELGITEGLFHVGLKFSEHYDEDFPEVFFNTIPFHPNS